MGSDWRKAGWSSQSGGKPGAGCNVSAYSGIVCFVPVLGPRKIASLENSTFVQRQYVVPSLPVQFVLPFPRLLNVVEHMSCTG